MPGMRLEQADGSGLREREPCGFAIPRSAGSSRVFSGRVTGTISLPIRATLLSLLSERTSLPTIGARVWENSITSLWLGMLSMDRLLTLFPTNT